VKILAGDIGGTKTILAIYEKDLQGVRLLYKEQFSSKTFETFGEVIDLFLKKSPPFQIDAAVLGVAGPVVEGSCHTTNLPWIIDENSLQKRLETPRVKLLNDLEATAYGMLYLPEDQFISLNPDGKSKKANRAVIAAGTGLGEAILYWDGKGYQPIGTEGGHTDFAPTTTQQDQLLKWLRNHYHSHVSIERVLSGSGVYTLYRFLAETGFAPEPSFMLELPEDTDPSAMVSKGALEYKDPLCIETLRLFTEIYGAEAGNFALKTFALGGVYIGGGIAPKILPFMEQESFLSAFLQKGRFEEMLRHIEVKIALDPQTALMGAARYAADRL
jgi:glucokinase